MTPLHVSDPVLPHRRKGQRSSFMSFPIAIIMIASIAGVPPIAGRLLNLDSVLHANNDRIVSCLIKVAPYAAVAVALVGLVLLFGYKHSLSLQKADRL